MKKQNTKNFATVLEEEQNNFKATMVKYPKETGYADRLLYLYDNLYNQFSSAYPRNLIPILQMYWTCFRGFIISTQLMFQLHIPEAYTIISRSAEAVASARRMSMNPEKIPEWIKAERNKSKPLMRVLGKKLFKNGDKVIYPEISNIYELTSEYGRHPSFKSIIFFSGLSQIETENRVVFTYSDIDEDKSNNGRYLNYQIYAYLKFLFAFREIFKRYLTDAWVEKLKRLEDEHAKYREKFTNYIRQGSDQKF